MNSSSWLRFLRTNSPGAKPELWRNLPFSLIRNLRFRIHPPKGFRTLALRNGLRIRADVGTSIGQALFVYRCWEFPVTELVDRLLAPDMVFVDVGANIGYFSVLASRVCARVIAFEPVPSIFAQLQENASLNDSSKIETHNLAVSDACGKFDFFVVGTDKNTGLSSLIEQPQSQRISADCATLDSFVEAKQLSQIGLIKIDVEGAEEKVLRGAPRLLGLPTAPDIIFECHQGATTDQLLRTFGYTIYELRRQRDYEARNLFASKRAEVSSLSDLIRKA